ncbi:MAG: DUF4124 domain-containing protein [Rhodanobacter sp.]
MNIPLATTLCLATVLLTMAQTVDAQSIYKCTKAGQVEYTDRPCSGANGKLIHQASDREIIDQYLDLGQDPLAERYASARHLDGLYKARLAAHQQKVKETAERRQQDEALAAQQRSEQTQQQMLADEAAHRNRLEAQNDLLREQNEQYRDQLTQPVYAPPIYWGASPRYGRGHRDHDHHGDHDGHNQRPPPVSDPPTIFRPCTQMAGGRVKC